MTTNRLYRGGDATCTMRVTSPTKAVGEGETTRRRLDKRDSGGRGGRFMSMLTCPEKKAPDFRHPSEVLKKKKSYAKKRK